VQATPVLRHRSLRSRWPLGLAVAALLLGQWLALLHAVGHGGSSAGSPAAVSPQGPGPWQVLGGHADTTIYCQLFDQLAQPAPLVEVPILVAAPLPALPLETLPQEQRGVAAPDAFHARAPPGFA